MPPALPYPRMASCENDSICRMRSSRGGAARDPDSEHLADRFSTDACASARSMETWPQRTLPCSRRTNHKVSRCCARVDARRPVTPHRRTSSAETSLSALWRMVLTSTRLSGLRSLRVCCFLRPARAASSTLSPGASLRLKASSTAPATTAGFSEAPGSSASRTPRSSASKPAPWGCSGAGSAARPWCSRQRNRLTSTTPALAGFASIASSASATNAKPMLLPAASALPWPAGSNTTAWRSADGPSPGTAPRQ
mmetsp:Transcript_106588/g.301548  ORF Transcript_106588/g.301548 Transcript_106588/m.301548 type:complete len:253 (+) Transcript_106588:295-1053(+)